LSSELTALCSDTLQVLLGRGVGIANLEEETLFANRLTVEFLDDLFTDLTRLKTSA